MKMRYIALFAAALSAPLQASDQFDLICIAEGRGEVRYRVDLAANEACLDACDRVWKMGQATSGELLLIDKIPSFRNDLEERASVNRNTGDYSYYLATNGRARAQFTGTCKPAPFSGFPAAKF